MTNSKIKRVRRIRAKIFGTSQKPRLAVFRSAKHIYSQLIDDEKGITLMAVSDSELKEKDKKPIEKAELVGKILAQKAAEKKIQQAVFDRRGYRYHGRVKALAEGARSGGLKI